MSPIVDCVVVSVPLPDKKYWPKLLAGVPPALPSVSCEVETSPPLCVKLPLPRLPTVSVLVVRLPPLIVYWPLPLLVSVPNTSPPSKTCAALTAPADCWKIPLPFLPMAKLPVTFNALALSLCSVIESGAVASIVSEA